MTERKITEVTMRIVHGQGLPEGWVNKIERSFYDWSNAQGVQVGVKVTKTSDVRCEADQFSKSIEAFK
jgi:hypothetical protein